MTIGNKKLFSVSAAIARGVNKADSHLVTDAESSATWDELAASHAKLVRDNPGAYVEIPNDPDF